MLSFATLLLSFVVASNASVLLQNRAVTCVKVGATATAVWTNAAGQSCQWIGVVGSNFGKSTSGGDFSCNGRCGAGCTGAALGNVYTQDCFSHDICSFFNNASGGASDPNCGAAFDLATDDTLSGIFRGCSGKNPVLAAVAPTTEPICK